MATLTLGCTFSDRIEALLDGRAAVPGEQLDMRIVEAQRLFRQVLRDAAYDVAELSMASHIAAIGAGRRDYVGVPVFLSRSFRHSNLYVRTDRGIARPGDLAGRTIGLVDWQQTAALWVRGLLADDHGVAREGVRWVAAGLHAPADDRAAMTLPPGIALTRSASTLDRLLAEGEVDAIISPGAPRCFTDATAAVARMWPDYRQAETAWWHARRLFPIMHVLVVRRALVEREPDLPARLYDAFEQARALASADVATRDFPKLTLPWLIDHAHGTRAALGVDPWTYGIEANRTTLETMLKHARADGMVDDRVSIEDLFR